MLNNNENFENIIVGGGWSGVEAARVLAQNKRETLLMTINLDSIGWIQDPEELANDSSWKLLGENESLLTKIASPKGSCNDRWRYAMETKAALDQLTNLKMRQDIVISVERKKSGFIIRGASGQAYKSKKLIICAGTFIGSTLRSQGIKLLGGGRDNEVASGELGNKLKNMGVNLKRSTTTFPSLNKNKKNQLSIKNHSGFHEVSSQYEVEHLVISSGQLNIAMEHNKIRGLFFAGKCAGAGSPQESALTGLIASLGVVGKTKEVAVLLSKVANKKLLS